MSRRARRMRRRARRFVAAPLAIAGDVVYEAALLLDMVHAMVSGEAYE